MPSLISEYVPQFVTGEEAARRRRARLVVWGAAASLVALFVGIIVLAPALRARGFMLASEVIYQSLRVACHQQAERSFHFEGFPLAVCARCFGLYAGAAAGLVAYPLLRSLDRTDAPGRAWLLAAALPTSVDFALGVLGVWENTHLSRFLTALLLGVASAFFIMPGLSDLVRMRFERTARREFARGRGEGLPGGRAA
ncbi:MAG TPA: DUF2085 domain-containing protein [Pyrinomonadaceae bacterium]|nr:DUF2085 domain-containing protein [Pyrinomonadaceae bacterium]